MDEVLAQSGLFQGLSEDAVEPVVSRLETITLPRGRVVFNEGEPGDSLYIVLSGKIKLSRRAPDGRENVLAVMGPSDQFGELSVFDPGPRTATATAVTDVKLARMPQSTLRLWIEAHPEIGEQLLRVLARELTPTAGSVSGADRIGYLPQQLVLHLDRSVADLLGVADRLGALDRVVRGEGTPGDLELVADDWDTRSCAWYPEFPSRPLSFVE